MQSRLAYNMPSAISEPNSATKIAGDQAADATTATTEETRKPPVDANGITQYPIVGQGDPKMPQNFTTWQETNNPHLFNFKWKPFSNGIIFDRLGKFGYKQLVNRIEGH